MDNFDFDHEDYGVRLFNSLMWAYSARGELCFTDFHFDVSDDFVSLISRFFESSLRRYDFFYRDHYGDMYYVPHYDDPDDEDYRYFVDKEYADFCKYFVFRRKPNKIVLKGIDC